MTPKPEELLEIYRLHAELADRVRQRRERANQLYGTFFAVLITAFIALATTNPSAEFKSIIPYIGLTGLSLSMPWWALIRSYQRLEKAKFELLYQLEKRLAFPFLTHERDSLRKTKDIFLYLKLDNAENLLPGLFFILSILSVICWVLPEIGLSCNILE